MKKPKERQASIEVDLSIERIELLLSAINEALEALEDWEFSTRTGFERGDFQEAYSELQRLLDSTANM